MIFRRYRAGLPHNRPRASLQRDSGFVLLMVLWAFVLLGLIATQLAAGGRSEVEIARNIAANAAADAAAEGAIYQAIFNLLATPDNGRWPLDRAPHPLDVGSSRVIVRLENEAARINPNTAAPALVEALLRVTGSDPDTAHQLAEAIAEWVGTAPVVRPASALFAEYQAAGLDYGPPGSALQTMGELSRVRGMSAAVLARLRPHLTLFGPATPDQHQGDPAVAAALVIAAQMPTAAGTQVPPPMPPGDGVQLARIVVVAQGPANAIVIQTAIAQIGASLPGGYSMLNWYTGAEGDT